MTRLYASIVSLIWLFLLVCAPKSGQAQTIFLFSFENTEAVTTGTGTFTSSGVTTPNYFAGVSGQARTHAGWDAGDYYQFTTNSIGYSGLTFSFYDRASNANINNFQIRYSTNGSTWTNVGAAFNPSNSFQPLGSPRTFSLPAACDNQTTLYIQLYKTNNAGAATTNIRIDEALLVGSSGCTAPSEPTAQSSLSTANPSMTSIDINWTGGNGSKILVVASTSATWTGALPADVTTYTADANFSGSGSVLGGGKVIYAGNKATGSVTLTNLSATTTYYFYTFNFNVGTPADCNPDYLTTAYTSTSGTTTSIPSAPASGLIINEVFNSSTIEAVELVVVGTPGSLLDIRGWVIDDNNGDFNSGSGSGVGIASGHIRFKNMCEWSAIPVGSIIVIYNESVGTPPLAIDVYDSNQDGVYVLAANNSLLEATTIGPSTSSSAYTGAYGTSSWNTTALKDACDCMQLRKPDYSLFQGISFSDGSAPDCSRLTQATHPHFATYNTEANFVAHTSGKLSLQFMNTVDNNWNRKSNWTKTESVTTFADGTLGVPNGGNNTTWIQSLRQPMSIATIAQSHVCTWSPNQTWRVAKPGVSTDIVIAQLAEQNGTNRGNTTAQTLINGSGTFSKTIGAKNYIFLSKYIQVSPTNTSAGNYSVTLFYTASELNALVNYLNTTYHTTYTIATLAPKIKMYRIPGNNLVAGTLVMGTSIFEITPTTGTYGSNYTFTGSFNAFSQYAIGVEDSPLPVEGMILQANPSEKEVLLTWNTLSERENMGFDIERSSNGYVFEKIAFVQGSTYSQGLKNYQYTDSQPINGKSYYRLNQKDLNGTSSLSNVVEVIFNPFAAITLYPNPTQHSFKLLGETGEVYLQMSMYNVEGKEILSIKGDIHQINTQLQNKVFTPGVYQIAIKKENQVHTLRLLVE